MNGIDGNNHFLRGFLCFPGFAPGEDESLSGSDASSSAPSSSPAAEPGAEGEELPPVLMTGDLVISPPGPTSAGPRTASFAIASAAAGSEAPAAGGIGLVSIEGGS